MALLAVLVLFGLANLTSTLFADPTGSGILDLGGGRTTLDARPGLTAAAATALVAQYGPVGRADHVLITLVSDILLPLTVFTFGALALLHALRRLGVGESWRRRAVLLPVAYLLADLGENAGIVAMLVSYPSTSATVAGLTVALTAVKSGLLALLLLAVVGSCLAGALRRQPLITRTGSATRRLDVEDASPWPATG